MIKKVTGEVHIHVFHQQLRDAKDNADGNRFNTSVQPYVVAVHNSSRYPAEEVFLRFAGNTVDAKFCKGRFVYINAWRNITTDPIENNHLAVYDETSLVSPDDNLASDLFLPGARSMQYGLSDHNVAKRRWYNFPKIQMDVELQFKQFASDTARDGASSEVFFNSSWTLCPTSVQLCLLMLWRRVALGIYRWSASCLSGRETTRTLKYPSDACL